MMRHVLIISLLVLCLSLACYGRTITVALDGSGEFSTIQAGIDAAVHGDEVVVGPGSYTGEGNRDIDFRGKAITVRSVSGPGSCIVNCQRQGRGFYLHSGEGHGSVIRGLTIQQGKAKYIDKESGYAGGGICCLGASPLIENCHIVENAADNYGGGLYLKDTQARIAGCVILLNEVGGDDWNPQEKVAGGGLCGVWTEISDSIVADNRAEAYSDRREPWAAGGGISGIGNITRCTIERNTVKATYVSNGGVNYNWVWAIGGGADSQLSIITDCVISGNTIEAKIASGHVYYDYLPSGGAGLSCYRCTVDRCKVMANVFTADRYCGGGGGIITWNENTITETMILYNSVERAYGGALYIRTDGKSSSTTIVDRCRIVGNSCVAFGYRECGGVYVDENTSLWGLARAEIRNCWFAGNAGGSLIDADIPTTLFSVKNCAFVRNRGDSVLGVYQWECEVANSLFWQNEGELPEWLPESNFVGDPHLTPDGHLKADSPCIDAGDGSVAAGDFDIDGEARVHGAGVDFGCDEFIDTDGDRLPDWWEMKYFGSTTAARPGDDPDRDGHTNLEEYEDYASDPTSGATFYVDAMLGDDRNDGTTPQTAKRTIKEAIDLSFNGDTVIIAPGRYTGPKNRDLSAWGRLITIRSTDPTDPEVVAATIIDANGLDRVFHFHDAETPACLVWGLSITGGRVEEDAGGGILCDRSSPTIRGCLIYGNAAYGRPSGGGGVACCDYSEAVIDDCIIKENTCDDWGGGLYLGESSNATIINSFIIENSAVGCGAGVYAGPMKDWFDKSAPAGRIEHCVISGNQLDRSGYGGAGIACEFAVTQVINCTITGNRIAGRSFVPAGAGLYYFEGWQPPKRPVIRNCVIWDNYPDEIACRYPCDGSDGVVTFSNIRNGRSGTGNIDANPSFAADGWWNDGGTAEDYADDVWVDGDYRLKSAGGRWDAGLGAWVYDEVTSPCIDAGDPASDWRGEFWPHGGRIN
ncbi:MAG: right-handed parallel beta-helix repeat-containing protein, partial [Phycisphaerae bacterium]|nr:right-handed parallel beta-helix repeat-containing protein [Phycisphaerae bacterium]